MTGTSSTTRSWITWTGLLSAAILGGTWFLGASPLLDRAAETRASTEDALVAQDGLRLRLAELREQYEHLDEYRAELATVRRHVPATADLAGYLDRLDALAAEHGVALTGVMPGSPVAAPPAPVPAAPAPADPAASPDAATDAATQAPADPAPASAAVPATDPAAPVTIPLSATATGTYDGVLAFVAELQEDGRIYVLTGMSATARTPGDVSPGHAPAAPGDVAVTLDGVLLVLPDPAPAAGAPAEDDAAREPLPTTARNPFTAVTAG